MKKIQLIKKVIIKKIWHSKQIQIQKENLDAILANKVQITKILIIIVKIYYVLTLIVLIVKWKEK